MMQMPVPVHMERQVQQAAAAAQEAAAPTTPPPVVLSPGQSNQSTPAVYPPHFTWLGSSLGSPPAQAQAQGQDPVSHPGPIANPDPLRLISQPASMLTSTGDEDTELVTSAEEDDIERERRSEFLTGRAAQERTDEINAASEAELEELRHERLDEEDEAKRLLCMACEVPACINVLKDTRDKEYRLHCQNAHRPMMQGCPSCEMAYMQQKGARKKTKYRITYNTLNADLLDMGVPDNNNERYGLNLVLHGKAFGDLDVQKRKIGHVTARAFHDSKSYIEALGAPGRPEDFRVEMVHHDPGSEFEGAFKNYLEDSNIINSRSEVVGPARA